MAAGPRRRKARLGLMATSGAGSELRRFGATARAIRSSARLSQAVVAERADLAVETVSRIERGQMNITLTVLHELAGALRVPVTALFDAAPKSRTRPVRRAAIDRAIALLEDLDDETVDDVCVALQKLLGARRRRLKSHKRSPVAAGA